MKYIYPRFEDLNITPDYLLIGASAMRNLIAYGHVRPTVRSLSDVHRREYNRKTRKSWAGRMKGKRIG